MHQCRRFCGCSHWSQRPSIRRPCLAQSLKTCPPPPSGPPSLIIKKFWYAHLVGATSSAFRVFGPGGRLRLQLCGTQVERQKLVCSCSCPRYAGRQSAQSRVQDPSADFSCTCTASICRSERFTCWGPDNSVASRQEPLHSCLELRIASRSHVET